MTQRSHGRNRPALSAAQKATIEAAILDEFARRPPTIGLIGVSGVGKSSTINAMFKTSLATSHTVACTKDFEASDIAVSIARGEAAGRGTILRVVDAPGLGEDDRKDPEYLEMYERHLGECDVILWVLAARNRAVALDQMYLRRLERFTDRMVFGINQVDLVEPADWRVAIPSVEQERNIEEIVADRRDRLESVLGRSVPVVGYSANRGYRLQELFTAIVEACPESRACFFGLIKNFDELVFLPGDARRLVPGGEAPDGRGDAPSPGGRVGNLIKQILIGGASR